MNIEVALVPDGQVEAIHYLQVFFIQLDLSTPRLGFLKKLKLD